MGLFDKIKNALFEEEIEVESAEEENKPKIKEDSVDTKNDRTENLSNDRELFKVDNTFNFPEFDEDEFAINYEPPKIKEKATETKSSLKNNVYEYEKKIKIKRETPSRNERNERVIKTEEVTKKVFKPSPIISPVYGILDKNYTKDDIITVEKTIKVKSNIDVDMVRKKAFGTLEEDLEKTLSEPIEEFYNEDTKSIDELLNDTIDDTIEITYNTEEIISPNNNDITANIEEELDQVDDLEVNKEEKNSEEIKETIEQNEEYLENNTLENDLFDLIDSMYDNKEED